MRSHFALLLFIFLMAVAVESRKDPTREYWRMAMKKKKEAMPEEIQGLLQLTSNQIQSEKQDQFVEDFEPEPNVSTHNNHHMNAEDKDKTSNTACKPVRVDAIQMKSERTSQKQSIFC